MELVLPHMPSNEHRPACIDCFRASYCVDGSRNNVVPLSTIVSGSTVATVSACGEKDGGMNF
jgi:hypothetical protein